MSADFLDCGERVELFNALQLEAESVRRWEAEQREPAPLRADDAVEAVGAVLRFLADGLSFGNMPARVAAMLLVVRPDLVGGVSHATLADEIGVSAFAIDKAIAELRCEFPTLRGGAVGSFTPERARYLRGEARRRRLAALAAAGEIATRRQRQREKALEDMRELDRRMGLA